MAQKIAKKLEGTDLVMPFNLVPVDVLEELVRMGVPVSTANVGSVSAEDKADFMRRKAEWEKKYPGARFSDKKMTKDEYAKWGMGAKKAQRKGAENMGDDVRHSYVPFGMSEEEIERYKGIEYSGTGPFGNIYTQFHGNATEAVKVLYANQGGDVIAALHHPSVGDVDLVWGYKGTGNSDGYGLSKLVEYHPEVVEDLQGMLDSMRVKKAGKNRIRLENDTHESAISLDWYGERKTWLLTAYRKREEAGTKTMNTGTNQKDDLQSDTALPQTSFLGSKDSNIIANGQENSVNNENSAEDNDENTQSANHAEQNVVRKSISEEQIHSDAFKAWFGDWENEPKSASKVVDGQGRPLVVYHGTKANFNTFAYNPEDIGFHFGNKTTARTRVGRGKNARLMPVYLDIKHPLVIDTDLGAWDADYLAEYLAKNNIADNDAIARVILTNAAIEKFETDVFDASSIQQIAPRYRRSSANANAKMRELLKGLGYDGIEYSNYYESNGSKSWIALDKSQIKSATENNGGYSPDDPDIRFSVSEEPSIDMMTVEEIKDEVLDYFKKAVSREVTGKPKSIGKLTKEGREYLEHISGLNMKEYVDFVLNPSDMTHIYNNHYGENEKDPGNNNPLTDNDIRAMVDVIFSPERVIYLGVDKTTGNKIFMFLLPSQNGTYNLAEVYGDRKGNLTAKSFYNTKKDISRRAYELEGASQHSTSETSGVSSSGAKIPQIFELPKLSGENLTVGTEKTENPDVLTLNGEKYAVADIEDNVRTDVQAVIDENELDAEIVGVKVIGSYMRGEQREDSDLDVLVEYKGNEREDTMFNIISSWYEENDVTLNGVKIDVNPITEGKSGTIEQFVKRNAGFSKKNLQDEAFVANLTQKSASIGDVTKILIKIATAKDWDENYAELPSNGDTLEGEVVRNSFTDDPMDIYENMTEDERREVADDAAENGWDFGGAVRRYVEKNGMPVSAAILHFAPIPRGVPSRQLSSPPPSTSSIVG